MSVLGNAFLMLLLELSLVNPIGSAYAQEPPAVPSLNSARLVGNWICSGSFRSGKSHKSSFTGHLIIDGKWLELSETDIEPHTGYEGDYLFGFDPSSRTYVEFDANSFGASVYRSPDGWSGKVSTFTSDLTGNKDAPYVADRFIYTMVSNGFSVDWQVRKTGGTDWVQADHLLCVTKH